MEKGARVVIYVWDNASGPLGAVACWEFPSYIASPGLEWVVKANGKPGQALLLEYTGDGDTWELIRRADFQDWDLHRCLAFAADGYGNGSGSGQPALKLGVPGLVQQFGAGLGLGGKLGNWLFVLLIILAGIYLLDEK